MPHQLSRYASRKSVREIPDCEQIVRRIDALSVGWLGIVKGVRVPGFVASWNVFALADHFKPESAQRPKNFRLRRVNQEFHPVVSDELENSISLVARRNDRDNPRDPRSSLIRFDDAMI